MITNIIQTQTGYRATIDGVEWSIPDDPGNRHWQMLQDAIANGAVVTREQPQAVTAPQEVSRFQAKAAFALAGKLAAADAVVAASTDPVVKLAWSDATVFKRNSPSINGLAAAIGLTQTDLDDLFRTAAGIVA
jgi:hypothetical protein